jgi:hypothetical protein
VLVATWLRKLHVRDTRRHCLGPGRSRDGDAGGAAKAGPASGAARTLHFARGRASAMPTSNGTGEQPVLRSRTRFHPDASARVPVHDAPARDEQRESRGARGSRLLWWQRDSAAKLITRACLRAIWQSQRCVISQGEPEYGRPRIGAQRPGQAQGAQTSTPWFLRPLCTEARRTVAIGTALMTSAGPALTYGAPRGIGNAPCAGVLADDEPGPVGTPAAPSRVAR